MSIKDEMFEIARKAIAEQYKAQIPEGYELWRIEEFDRAKHRAPHLLMEGCRNPKLKYIASIHGGTDNYYRAVTELGETATQAVEACLANLITNH